MKSKPEAWSLKLSRLKSGRMRQPIKREFIYCKSPGGLIGVHVLYITITWSNLINLLTDVPWVFIDNIDLLREYSSCVGLTRKFQ